MWLWGGPKPSGTQVDGWGWSLAIIHIRERQEVGIEKGSAMRVGW